MIDEALQLRLDQMLATCRQRWWLGGGAVVAVLVAALTITVGASSLQGGILAVCVTTALAIAAVAGAGSHYGSVTIAAVGVTWLAIIDDPATPRSMAVATCLYVFHALLALMAATRHTSPIDVRILARWAARSVGVLGATVAVWVVVVVFDGRTWSGSATLTSFALVIIALAAFTVRHQIIHTADRS